MSNKPFNVVATLAGIIDIYWDDPQAFAEDILEARPEDWDEWQKKVLFDIAHSKMTSVRSGQGVGKTALEAMAIIWFLCCRPYPKVVATAPTRQQLYDVLWAEVAKWLNNSKVKNLLQWTKTKVYMIGHDDRWFATAKTATKPENMQGYHEEYMLFIVDEASGVADLIMEAILGTLSGDENKLLMCGNPTRNSGTFYDSHHKDRANYKNHKVSSLNSKRTSKENIEMLKRKYHEDSDVYRVRVLGEFPKAEPDVFISLDIVEAAIMRELEDDGDLEIGVDVARYGDDETVIAPRVGPRLIDLKTYSKQDTMKTAGWVITTAKDLMNELQKQRCVVKIDDDGIGGGVTDRVREVVQEEGLNIHVVDCHNGGAPGDKEHYEDWGAESWASIRDHLQDGDIQLIDDDDLVGQLTTRKYTITSKGRIRLETKKEMKKRGLHSPDRADAVVLAFAPSNIINVAPITIDSTSIWR
jgi:Phage terminase large subunit.